MTEEKKDHQLIVNTKYHGQMASTLMTETEAKELNNLLTEGYQGVSVLSFKINKGRCYLPKGTLDESVIMIAEEVDEEPA